MTKMSKHPQTFRSHFILFFGRPRTVTSCTVQTFISLPGKLLKGRQTAEFGLKDFIFRQTEMDPAIIALAYI